MRMWTTTSGKSCTRMTISRWLPVVLLMCPGAASGGVGCPLEPAQYTAGGFQVRQIRFATPLDFIQAVDPMLGLSKTRLPLSPGSPFSASLYSAGTEALTASIRNSLGDATRFRISVVTASLENCDAPSDPNPKLDVVYRIFFFNFPAFAAPLLDTRRSEISQPTAAAASQNVQGTYVTTPVTGYNASRGVYGGINGSVAAGGSVFDSIHYGVFGSETGTSGEAGLQGSRNPGHQWLSHDTYAVEYFHSNLPSTLTSLRKSAVAAHFLGETKPLADGLTLRYGARLEGGNQQSNLAIVPDGSDLASSKGGELKLLFGLTTRGETQSFALSGGLALGSAKAGLQLDYAKAVLDGEWDRAFAWPALARKNDRHHPIAVETRAGLGQIWLPGKIPVADRFFGGNEVAHFVDDPSWQLRDGPLIRSIPQGRLAGAGFGGDRFFSFNLTLAPVVKAWPLVPREVLKAPGFEVAKQTAINTGKRVDQLYYEGQQQAAKDAAQRLQSMVDHLKALQAALDMDIANFSDDAKTALASAVRSAGRAERAASSAANDPSLLPAVPGNAAGCLRQLQALIDALPAAPQTLSELHAELQGESRQLADDLKRIDRDAAMKKADQDFAVVEPALNTFLYELNRLALSPVAIFDVAHLSPDRVPARYALGGGVRVTFFVVNLTAGYAWNLHPDRQLRIGAGAAFFSLQITDIFR